MKFIMYKSLMLILLLANTAIAQTLPYKITAYGFHAIDIKTNKKYAVYKYKFENLSKIPVEKLIIGQKNYDEDLLLDKRISRNDDKARATVFAPAYWLGSIVNMSESYFYAIEWNLKDNLNADIYGIQSGKSNDGFSVQLERADPNYVSTYAMSYFVLGAVKIDSYDKAPPSISISINANSTLNKVGWLEVNVSANIHDAYDPYPVALLTKITSNQKISANDIDAIYNEETRKFWVKKAPNRSYTIEYTGMDASGNKVVTTSTIWAAQ